MRAEGGNVAWHAREGAGLPAPARSVRARLCSHVRRFWPRSLSSAAHGEPPAAARPGAWLLAVALGTAACRAGARSRFREAPPCAGPARDRGAAPQQRYRSESLRRGIPPPHANTSRLFFRGKRSKLNSKNGSRHLVSKKKKMVKMYLLLFNATPSPSPELLSDSHSCGTPLRAHSGSPSALGMPGRRTSPAVGTCPPGHHQAVSPAR